MGIKSVVVIMEEIAYSGFAAIQAHGGFGVALENDIERYFREPGVTTIVPVYQQLALSTSVRASSDFPIVLTQRTLNYQ